MTQQSEEPQQTISSDLLEVYRLVWPGWRTADVQALKLKKKRERLWKNIYAKFVCQKCGRCCLKTAWAKTPRVKTPNGEILEGLTPSETLQLIKNNHNLSASMTGSYVTWEDICRWRREGREDILRYVHSFEGFGGIIYDRQENKTFRRCPFLKSENDGKYSCAIHETKPFVCAAYPTFYDPAGLCPYCGNQVREEDFSCLKCGGILAFDPRSVVDDCPGTRQVLMSLLKDMKRKLQPINP